jgi:spermidine dehydrogenase
MNDDSNDKKLAMDRKITRRDFLDGVGIAVGGAVLASNAPWVNAVETSTSDFAPEKASNYYPPALVGMRGNHEGTYTHAYQALSGDLVRMVNV